MNRQLNEKGFTLVELLVALTVMAIGILSVVQMQIVAIKSNSIAQRLTVANNIAQEVMEDIQARSVDDAIFSAAAANVLVDFLTDPRIAVDPDVPRPATNSLTFPDSGTFRAFYTVAMNAAESAVVITVNTCLDDSVAAADVRCGNVAGRRRLVGTTSFKGKN